MLFVTWNVNSLRARLLRVLELLERHGPDVVALQETKCSAATFPEPDLNGAGYTCVHSSGGQWAGVALLVRRPLEPSQPITALTGDVAPHEARWCEATVAGIRFISTYVPNGRALEHTEFARKLAFFGAARARVSALSEPVSALGQPVGALGQPVGAHGEPVSALSQPVEAPGQPVGAPGQPVGAPGQPVGAPGQPVGAPGQPVGALSAPIHLLLAGDMNVAPDDADVYDPAAYVGATHVSVEERDGLRDLMGAGGLLDAYRTLHPDERQFTWWDYRAGNFHKNIGMRIDLILADHGLCKRLSACGIDRDFRKGPRPSDHAPLLARWRDAP